MDQNAVNSTLQSLAFGEAMKAAAEDYKKANCPSIPFGSIHF